MKKMLILIVGILIIALFAGIATAKIQQRDRDRDRDCTCGQFIDVDGDGICDNCNGCIPSPKGDDDDGDGIPNGQDDDYSPPKDGSGRK